MRSSRRPRRALLVALALVAAACLADSVPASLALFSDARSVGANAFDSGSWNTGNYQTLYLHNNPTPPTGNTTTALTSSVRTRTGYIATSAPAAPAADFGAGPQTIDGCNGTVQFYDASTNDPTSWAWDFDDDGTTDSTAQNPTFGYGACGVYSVRLTATNASGSNTVTRTSLIELRAVSPQTKLCSTDSGSGWSNRQNACSSSDNDAAATASVSGGLLSGDTVTTDWGGYFSADHIPTDATLTEVRAEVRWMRSNSNPTLGVQLRRSSSGQGSETTATPSAGTWATATQQVSPGAFTRADLISGNLQVRVRCSVGILSSGTCSLDYVRVRVTFSVPSIPAAPSADFTATPTSAELGATLNFSEASSGTIDRWIWDFDGDGRVDTVSTSATNPNYGYASPGTYTPRLVVVGQGGADVRTRAGYISINPPSVPGTANTAEFFGEPIAGTTPLAVAFSDRSSGAPWAWSWDLGDGTGSQLRNPLHTYAVGGTQTVTLTASYGPSATVLEPTATTLFSYSTDVDPAAPGRVVRRGGVDQDEGRAGYQLSWRSAPFDAPRLLDGNILVRTWASLAGHGPGKGVVTVYVRDFDPDGGTSGNYVALASQTLTFAQWTEQTGDFYQRDFAVRVNNYTLAAGRQVELKLIVVDESDDDMWFAYDTTSYPAFVRLP